MHFVAHLLDTYNRHPEENPRVELRGYSSRTWADADYQFKGVSLSVSQVAYSPCQTSRDLYFEQVKGIRRPQTWPRIVGRAVDALYRLVHETARSYCHSVRGRNFDLVEHLTREGPTLVDQVLRDELRGIESVHPKPPGAREQRRLRVALEKISRFEARLLGSTIERDMADMPTRRPGEIFDQHFDFNVQFGLATRKHGFTSPATPDFLYHQCVLGDIKVGEWQPYHEYTMVAYALAYEEVQGSDLDLGAILLVQCPPRLPVPAHQGSCIQFLDDTRRKRFLIVRDRKLQIVAEKKDPGRAECQDDCDRTCPYWDRCWGDPANG